MKLIKQLEFFPLHRLTRSAQLVRWIIFVYVDIDSLHHTWMNHMFAALYDIFTNIFLFCYSLELYCVCMSAFVTLHVKKYISEVDFHEWKSSLYYGYIICHHHCTDMVCSWYYLIAMMMMMIIALQTLHAYLHFNTLSFLTFKLF